MNKNYLNEFGQEVLDPTPMAVPFGCKRPATLQEQMMRLMRIQYDLVKNDGVETPEEANDFNVGDDFEIDPISGHEFVEDDVAKELPSGNLKEDFLPEKTSEENPPGANSEEPSA